MSQPVRVVVKLPYNKPENAPPDPPKIEWTPEKADILWKVIEIQRTRAVDSAADWKGLAAHLGVPLPYLLYRVNARFQEEIRGLKDIQGALSPSSPQQQFPVMIDPNTPTTSANSDAAVRRLSNGTPLDVRARLNSLSNISMPRHKKSSTSSSIMTLQAPRKLFTPLMRPTSPSSSGDEADSSDEEAIKEEEAERIAEEDDALTRKLVELQKMMTTETLGLVSGTSRHMSDRVRDRGRSTPLSPRSGGSFAFSNHSVSRSGSHSISSASSHQGSIPEIPSPTSERGGNMAVAMPRTMLNNPSNPQRVSRRDFQDRHLPLMDRTSDLSNQGSEASSFSDLSDASISTSAMEDAIMSNLGSNNTSHYSHHARSRLSSRTQSSIPQ